MWNNFLVSLEIMGKGMGGIFVVVLIITAVVMILGKLK
nr:OadG-related small transporter subunit [Otoolea muris]